MQMRKWFSVLAACSLAVSLTVTAPAPARAQDKLQQSPGGYHGELDFPISWKRYYSYDEWTKIIHDLQDQYDHLADIQSIGKSRMGRDQYLLTITAESTGSADSKPAMWVDGAIHGNEVNGIMCSLYTAWYLLTRYDYDPFVHDLVNTTTFYILPGLNVDANDSFVRFPNTPNNPREPYRPEDNDGDGLYDEDQTEDVDGDGELSYMYVEDPDGPLKLSADGRVFVEVADENEQVTRFRRIGAEGYDNDGDGRINEDDIGGPDPNRNFPYGWTLADGNPYPMSEPETRNVWEFQRVHPNIFASFHFHNTGRLIMFQAPPAVEGGAQRDAGGGGGFRGPQLSFEERLAQLRETNQYAQLFERQVAPEYQHDMDVQTAIVTMGARILKNYEPTIGGLSGQAHAATYYMLGAYSYLIELWGSPDFAADENGDGRVSDEETLKWIDTELMGEGWITPHKVNHPDLGEIWIGGSQKKHTQRTPPARYIEMEAEKNSDFVLYCASQFPEVEIGDITFTPEAGNLYWVDVEVKNEKVYPTSSDRANQLGIATPDKLTIRTASNVRRVDVPTGRTQIDPSDPGGATTAVGEETHDFRLQGQDTQIFRYLVEVTGSGGWVEFEVDSFFGGTATKRAQLR
ncbi:MAG: M14 family metallopeptidase [Gemmatimonadota bacterium]